MKNRILKQAYEQYKTYYFRALLLEVIAENGVLLDEGKLDALYWEKIQKEQEITWNSSMFDTHNEFKVLVKLGLVKADVKTKNVVLTDEGFKAVQNATWHNLATNSWIGYKTLHLGHIALRVSLTALIVAIVSLLSGILNTIL